LKQQCAVRHSDGNALPISTVKPAAAAVLSLRPVTGTDNSSSSSSQSGGSSTAAAVAEATALLRGSQCAKEAGRLGVLKVEVYVYTTRGPRHRCVTYRTAQKAAWQLHHPCPGCMFPTCTEQCCCCVDMATPCRMVTLDDNPWEGSVCVNTLIAGRSTFEGCLLRQTMYARLLQASS